ncbi:hypothetical protein GN278_08845 [Rhodobacteraceae bacterium Araon29]
MSYTTQDLYASCAVLVLFICNLVAMRLWQPAQARPWTTSFAGGAAAAYVFLVLIPEIENGHRILGKNIHLVTLVGFVLFYIASVIISQKRERPGVVTYGFEMTQAVIYQFLLVFTLHENIPENLWMALIFVLGPGLHLIQQRHGLASSVPQSQGRMTTGMLEGALLAGWLVGFLTEFSIEIIGFLTALIAGSIMLRAFKEELSARKNLSPLAFSAGILIVGLPGLMTG